MKGYRKLRSLQGAHNRISDQEQTVRELWAYHERHRNGRFAAYYAEALPPRYPETKMEMISFCRSLSEIINKQLLMVRDRSSFVANVAVPSFHIPRRREEFFGLVFDKNINDIVYRKSLPRDPGVLHEILRAESIYLATFLEKNDCDVVSKLRLFTRCALGAARDQEEFLEMGESNSPDLVREFIKEKIREVEFGNSNPSMPAFG